MYGKFYSKLKGGFTITLEEHKDFDQEFHSRGCVMTFRVHSDVDIILFIEAVDKTRDQCYPGKINMLKDAVSILGISMTCMLNKALKMKKSRDPDLHAPGQPCNHKCNEGCL